MKRILIVSDTHGDTSLLNRIILENQKCDLLIHLGDSELPSYMLDSFVCVKGNCDFHIEFPRTRDLSIDNIKIHLEHGDRIRTSINNYIANIDCDIFIFGHTHISYVSTINEKLIINPGSLTRPRDSNEGSYAILTIDNSKTNVEIIRVKL